MYRKRIKYKGTNFNINVFSYENGRIGIKLINNNDSYDISINLPDYYLEKDSIFLNPDVKANTTLYKLLRKCKVIKDVTSIIICDYNPIPITKVNLKKLEDYDYDGVMKYINVRDGIHE